MNKRKLKGRKAIDGLRHGKAVIVWLDEETKRKAREIGGNVSAGIRIAVKAFRN